MEENIYVRANHLDMHFQIVSLSNYFQKLLNLDNTYCYYYTYNKVTVII